MPIQGDAPWVLGVCWALTALVLVFVLLRIYTRVRIVDSFGYDDSTYIAAYVRFPGAGPAVTYCPGLLLTFPRYAY